MQEPKFIIVIGASAGGTNAISQLLAQLPQEINAAVFIVLHLSDVAIGNQLISRFQRNTSLTCVLGEDREPIKKGTAYIAPANGHLVISADKIVIGHGPKENRWRPSIDVLFRSAAAAYGERVIGIILSGMLNDGTAGIIAIQRSGGTCILQDPNDAEFPEMVLSAFSNIQADYSPPVSQMGAAIMDVVSNKQLKGIGAPPEIKAEAAIAERASTGIDVVRPLASQSVYTCPDCGGGLWEITEQGFHRYRCNIGHAYTETELLKRQSAETESTLWIALRMMEERKDLLKKIEGQEKSKGLLKLATAHANDAMVLQEHIVNLKSLLFQVEDKSAA
jgi:two-component system, chemotaxis family, protein-glutamate methylesterase/glutaminase